MNDLAAIHQAAYDVLPKDADDELYALADRISEAVARVVGDAWPSVDTEEELE